MHARRTEPFDLCLWVLSAMILGGIIYWSFTPEPSFPVRFHGADRVYHALAYGALTLSLLFATVWRRGRGAGIIPSPWIVIVAVVVLGIAAEIIQGFVDRDPNVFDAVADAVGALLAYLTWRQMGGVPRRKADRADWD